MAEFKPGDRLQGTATGRFINDGKTTGVFTGEYSGNGWPIVREDNGERWRLDPSHLIVEVNAASDSSRPLVGPAPTNLPVYQAPFEYVSGDIVDATGDVMAGVFHADGAEETLDDWGRWIRDALNDRAFKES